MGKKYNFNPVVEELVRVYFPNWEKRLDQAVQDELLNMVNQAWDIRNFKGKYRKISKYRDVVHSMRAERPRKTYAKIGKILGLSRQRIEQIDKS